MAKICQIGSGMIGQTMALDLAENHDVCLGDIEIDNVNDKIKNHPLLTVIGNACDNKAGCQLITGLGHQIEISAQGWQSFS